MVNIKKVETVEYRIPICEFGKTFGITDEIDTVYYYKSQKPHKDDNEEDYVTVEVKQNVAPKQLEVKQSAEVKS